MKSFDFQSENDQMLFDLFERRKKAVHFNSYVYLAGHKNTTKVCDTFPLFLVHLFAQLLLSTLDNCRLIFCIVFFYLH